MDKVSIGISFVICDEARNFNLTDKVDPFEFGRTFARAQQVIGLFNNEKNLGIEALRKNNLFFGNDPEVLVSKKKKNKVKENNEYFAHRCQLLFKEDEWKEKLSSILLALLRRYTHRLTGDVKAKCISDNLLQHSDNRIRIESKTQIITDKKGNRRSKLKIPSKPKANNLFIKEENKLISEFINPVFKDEVPHEREKFSTFILETGFRKYSEELASKSNIKNNLLMKFASMTTKRLNETRKSAKLSDTKRKKDISLEEVKKSISLRKNRSERFANELLSLVTKENAYLFDSKFIVLEKTNGSLQYNYKLSEVQLKSVIDKENIYGEFEEDHPNSDESEEGSEFIKVTSKTKHSVKMDPKDALKIKTEYLKIFNDSYAKIKEGLHAAVDRSEFKKFLIGIITTPIGNALKNWTLTKQEYVIDEPTMKLFSWISRLEPREQKVLIRTLEETFDEWAYDVRVDDYEEDENSLLSESE